MLYLTYNNTDATDGAGAQLQRILSAYILSKYFKVGYIHSPIYKLGYAGIENIVNSDSEIQLEQYNSIFDLPSDEYTTFDHIVTLKGDDTTTDKINYYKAQAQNQNILLKIAHTHRIVDSLPAHVLTDLPYFNWIPTRQTSDTVNVAVHIRRGEIRTVCTERLLPIDYYVSIVNQLADKFKEHNIPHTFHIYSEENIQPILIQPTDILNQKNESVVLEAYSEVSDIFSNMENVILHINTPPVETLRDLINADCFVASRSSFSYVAALVNPNRLVIFHPFWHILSENWVVPEQLTNIDIRRYLNTAPNE